MARFFNTQLVKPISSFVAEPLDFYQSRLDDMQKKQDAYRINIDGLDKETSALENDVPGAIQRKKELEGQLSSIRDININDPIESRKAVSQMGELQKEFSQYGYTGAVDRKKKEYDLATKEITDRYKNNPMMLSYNLNRLREQNLKPENAVYFENGIPRNVNINLPQEFEYKDKTKVLPDLLKSVAADQVSYNSGLTEDGARKALLSYVSGNVEERTGKKIYDNLKAIALADPNLMKSIQAEAEYFGQDPNVLFETSLAGVAGAGKFKKQDLERKYRNDAAALRGLDKELSEYDSTPHLDTGVYDPVNSNPIIKSSQQWFKDGKLQATSPDVTRTYTGSMGSYIPGIVKDGKVENPNYTEQISIINNARQKLPNATKGMNDQQVMDFYTKSLGENGQVSFNAFDLNGLNTEKLSKKVTNNLSGKKIMLTGNKDLTTLSTVAKQLDLPEDELESRIKEAKVNGIKPTSVNNPGSFKVTIIGGDNLPHEVTIEGDKDQQRHFAEYDKLMSFDKNGMTGQVVTDNYMALTDMQEYQKEDGTFGVNYGTVILPFAKGSTTKKEIEQKFGSLEAAEEQGMKFVKKSDGNYTLALTNQPMSPEDLGRDLVHDWSAKGLRNYQERRNDKPTYSDEE